MARVWKAMIIGGIALAPSGMMRTWAQAAPSSATLLDSSTSTSLPPPPQGRSTILGGEIRDVDPVMDRFTLRVFGQKPMKIFFDERTQVFRDGKKMPLHDLAACDHASVQTTLDNTAVFALSIHMLSAVPVGDFNGRVLSYAPATGELSLEGGPGSKPFRLRVSSDAAFTRLGQAAHATGQPGASDLVPGALVSASFQSDKAGQGMATEISVLAVPGSSFVFIGSIVSLDLHSGSIVIADPRDEKNYQIAFDSSRMTETGSLHTGDHVRVSATYDGSRYLANQIVQQ